MRRIIYIVLIFSVAALGYSQVDTEAGAEDGPMLVDVNTAVAFALDNNFSIRKRQEDVLASEREYKRRWNVFVPDVNLSLALGYNLNDTSGTPTLSQAPSEWILNPTLQTSLSLSFDTIARWQLLRLQYQAQDTSMKVVQGTVRRDVRKIFYDILLQRTSIEIAKAQLGIAEELFALTESAYRSGLKPEYDALLTELQVEQDKVSIARMEAQYKQLVDNFKFLLGLPQEMEIDLEGTLDIDTDMIRQVINEEEPKILSRPDIQGLYTQLDLLKKQKSLQEQLLIPRISLAYTIQPTFTGDVWSSDLTNSDSWFNKAGVLSVNISFSVGNVLPSSNIFTERYKAIRQAEKQQLAIEEAVENATITTENLRTSILSGLELVRTTEINVDIAERAFSLARDAYEAGLRTYDQLREMEMRVRQVRLSLLQEQRNVLQNLAEWVYTMNVPETGGVLF